MIFHISIPAREPQVAAEALAEITGGRAFPFHPVDGAQIVFYGDANGLAIEVYPEDAVLSAGPTMLAAGSANAPARTGFHAAIASPLDEARIMQIASNRGWLARRCNRGPFELIEMWIDNRLLIEVLGPDMQADYRAAMTPENWAAWD